MVNPVYGAGGGVEVKQGMKCYTGSTDPAAAYFFSAAPHNLPPRSDQGKTSV
jgi:hypothetical protein